MQKPHSEEQRLFGLPPPNEPEAGEAETEESKSARFRLFFLSGSMPVPVIALPAPATAIFANVLVEPLQTVCWNAD